MDNRKRIQLAISVWPVGAIVSCVGKLIPVCGCLAPGKRQHHRRPPGGALIKTALRKMSKTFKCEQTNLAEKPSSRGTKPSNFTLLASCFSLA